ncbi:hypothetical protein LCGC14_0980610 [marine sediment metagenome]|uniref:Uncharacterized protein n=1 Tax=marine sediment metagenome TaxID=412755 RepID=A0A0F9RFE7_9ZZZZ
MDSYDVTITIKTTSINGKENGEDIKKFTDIVIEVANKTLTRSTLEIDIVKHRLIRG